MFLRAILRTFASMLSLGCALAPTFLHAEPTPVAQPPQSQTQTQTPATPNAIVTPKTQPLSLYKKAECHEGEGYTVNFEDISVVQLIQFISKISGTNFIFNSQDLNFTITIVSEDATSVADLSAALLQVLNMHGLTVSEQGNNVLIYRDQAVSKVSRVITDDNINDACDTAIVTRVFQLYNLNPTTTAALVRPLLSPSSIVEPSLDTNHLIVTDITANVNKIADLLSALDSSALEMDVGSYDVNNADATILAQYAKEILAPLTRGLSLNIVPEPVSKKIFIVGTPALIAKAQQILGSLDAPDIAAINPVPEAMDIRNNQLYMYKLKYQEGALIAEAMREIGMNLQYTGVANIDFVNAIFTIQWIEANNSIIITGTDSAIKKVVALLDDLDQLPKQVYIEMLVLDTTLSNSLDFGVQWVLMGNQGNLGFASGLLGANAGGGSPFANNAALINAGSIEPIGANVPLPVGAFPTETFGLGVIGNIIRHNGQSFLTLGALVSALDQNANSTIVLNPRIMVEDAQPANFFVGQNIPYQTTSTVIQQTGSVTQNIQYEDIGVQLQVTPMIAPNNMVTLQINQTVAEVLDTGTGSTLTPTTNKTLSSTRVHVPDGTFLVMSGQIRDEVLCRRSGIPCLGTLPLIGPAFSRTIESRSKRNLMFFIRPKVVTNITEGLDLTNEEGYKHNWGSRPESMCEAGPEIAPECEMYPSPNWPIIHPYTPPPYGMFDGACPGAQTGGTPTPSGPADHNSNTQGGEDSGPFLRHSSSHPGSSSLRLE